MSGLTGPLLASSIKSAVAEMLAQDITIPDGHRGVIVSVVNLDRVEVVLATRVVDRAKVDWNVSIIGSHSWDGDNALAIINKITWE